MWVMEQRKVRNPPRITFNVDFSLTVQPPLHAGTAVTWAFPLWLSKKSYFNKPFCGALWAANNNRKSKNMKRYKLENWKVSRLTCAAQLASKKGFFNAAPKEIKVAHEPLRYATRLLFSLFLSLSRYSVTLTSLFSFFVRSLRYAQHNVNVARQDMKEM